MNLNDARKMMPELNGLSDQDAVDVIHQVYYPAADKAKLSTLLGVAPPAPPAPPQAGVLRTMGDMAIKGAQGVVDLGSSVVGLGSLATGGLVGQGARAIGYDPKRTNEILGEYLSDSQKASDNAVSSADGFTDAIAASIQNPRAIAGSIVQSAPGMIGGMGVTNAVAGRIAARAALATAEGASASAAQLAAGKSAAKAAEAALATKAGGAAAQAAVEAAGSKLVALGAATEGAQSAGQIADDAQAAGRGYGDYALPALAAGAGTAAIGLGAGKLMGDSATQIATGAKSAGVHGNMATRAAKEFISEGLLEEAPQSAQEQYFTNIAQGEQDRSKGVANAAGSGLITGGVMGAGMGAIQHDHGAAAPVQLPNTGPLSQAANAGQAALAAQANATAPQGTAASAAPAGPSLADIDARMAELVAIGQGSTAKRAMDAAGNKNTIPAVAGRPLTQDEIAEFNGLKQARAERTAIPAEQQGEFNALLQQEQAEQNQKYAATIEAAKASRAAAEDQQIHAMLADDERRQREAEQQHLAQQIADSDARVEQARLAQAAANRAALRDQILANDQFPTARQKKKAMRAALVEGGYTHADLTDDDHRAIDSVTTLAGAPDVQAAPADAALDPIPSAPNELVDAVPERAAPAPAPAGTNTRAVDEAIASGMRLKTASGKLLHKPGSNKVFRLSDAQKDYYLQAIERQARGESAPVVAPIAPAEEPAAPAAAPSAIDLAAHEAATSPLNDLPEPTEAQKEAGNYKVGRASLHGLDLSIENPAGSTRRGVDRDGTAWENTMQHHYGYIRGTVGADKDHIDAFIGPHQDSEKVFVIDQVHPDNRQFDEHKVMLGFDSRQQALAAYQSNYAANWTGADRLTETDIDGFKTWLARGKTAKAFADRAPAHAIVHDLVPAANDDDGLPTPAPAAAPEVARTMTKSELNKLLVPDMSDDQLRQARTVFAGLPREPKILRELARRGLDAAAPVADAAAPMTNTTPAEAGPNGMHANATAPEHIHVGVDDRELGQIVDEFNAAQADMMDGEHPVSNVFQPPAKGDVVRLQEKSKGKLWNPVEVKAYNKNLDLRDELTAAGKPVPAELDKAISDFEAVYLPHVARLKAEAAVEIGSWKDHAKKQGMDPATRSANGRKIVLSLFDLSGEWSRPWEEAGYQVYRFDIQDDPVVGDVNNFSTDFFGDWFGDFDGLDIYAILAATPCTDFAVSGARHFAAKDADGRTVASVKLVHQTLRTIEYFKPAVWGLENPVGRIEKLGGLPPWRLSFDPNHLGDSYTKKTLIWGRFNANLPVAPVEPTEGSKMHKLYGGKSMATKNARSVTPEGFSYGFFMANNAIDHPAMAIANKYDRLDRSLIEQALATGVTEDQINDAVEDHYYMDLDDDAANDALRTLIDAASAPVEVKYYPLRDRHDQLRIKGDWEPQGNDWAKIPATNSPAGIEAAIAQERADGSAPVLRPAPNHPDLKSYTTEEAQAEWDSARPGKRGMFLGRIEQRDSDMLGKSWDELTPAERLAVQHALNEDFYSNMWYVNTRGQQVALGDMPQAAPKSAAQLADEQAAITWADMPPRERYSLLLAHHVGKDAEQGQHVNWDQLGPDLRARIAATLAAQARAPLAAAEAPAEAKPAKKGKAKAAPGAAVLRQDYGVKHIDGYTDTPELPADRNGDQPTGGVKEAFLKDTKAYLQDVAAVLQERGFTAHVDGKGKAMKPVHISEGGPAGSGDVSLAMYNESAKQGIYVKIGETLGGFAPSTASNIGVMMRVTERANPYGGHENRWMPTDLNAKELASYIETAVTPYAAAAKSTTLTPNQEQKDNDGHSDTGRPSAAPLDHLAAGQDGAAAVGGHADGSDAGGREGGAAADQRADEPARAQGARSAGVGAEGPHPVTAGTAKRGRLGSAGAERQGNAVPADDARGAAPDRSVGRARGVTPAALAAQAEPAAPAVQRTVPAAPNVPAQNFRITDALQLGEGSELVKFNDNLTAIATLKAIEGENRRATPAEQSLLARYVGWGGLANAFPSPETGEYKDAWAKRGPQLAELLTPKEYALARRSTLDSHYTSKTVVDAMWAAARRLGYQGGLALESSMGAGNFIGLMPEQLASHTKFVGVEYDSLTARIASLLYPQETVLNAGFQNVPLPDGSFDLAIGNPPFGEQSLRFQFKPEINGHSIHNQFFLGAIDAVKPGGLQVQVVSRYLLDKQDKSSRVALAKRAKLLGAIRLPDTAFKENARTSVVTDIVFLQRLTPAEETHMAIAFDAAAARPEKSRDAEAERQALIAHIPAWVNTTTVADPLGGDAIPVNSYFAAHPDMVLGTLERSGKMAYRGDVTVRPAEGIALSEQLARAIAALPQDVMVQAPDAIAASLARHKDMSEALRIVLAGHENGAIRLENDGALMQVIERETPEGGYELTRRVLSPTSPWSDQLYLDRNGQWYSVEAVNGTDGKPLKVIKDGKVTKRNVYERKSFGSDAEIPASMQLGQTRFERLKQMVQLRDLLKEQITRETENATEADIEANRAQLAQAYAAFTKAHGYINEPANAALVANMPDGALVQALEFGYRPAISAARAARAKEKARPASAEPAPILSKRVIVPYEAPTAASSTADALAITLAEQGKVDLERIGALVGKSAADIAADMAAMEHPLLFKDPESGQWQTRSEYLSGQVKRKLGAAREAGLQQNIAALEAVQPEAWGAESVTALLGSSWIPSDVYADFIAHLSGNAAEVRFAPLTNSFSVNAPTTTRANEEEWGSTGYKAAELVSDLLNSKPIRVMTRDANDNLVVHREYTDLALLKARAIVNEFNDWVYKDGERRARLVGIFNDKFNTRVNRQHDGSHLVLPGKVPDAVISMRRHQKNAIWRGISERFMLVDHTVGAGKTFTAIARAMERRRMGLSKKPAIIVPNHMVEQFAADVYRLYPGAKVLAAGKKDFERSRRRQLFAKIATGDFDIVIIPHSSFGFIGIAPETEERYLQAELAQAQQAVIDAQEAADENGHEGFRKPFGVKEAERLVDTITARMDAVKGSKNRDRLLTFEQMGIDDMTVDEFHEFKNLWYSSRLTGVKGMGNKTGSQKAFDMYNKIRVLRDSPTGTVTAMTGTPISNSAVEMYTMMRYLAAGELRDMGLEHFDAWRAQFVSADAGWEPTETGRLKEVNRLGRTWSNMRSLMDLYYSFTDSVDNDAIKAAYAEDNNGAAFPIPQVKGGDRQSIVIQPTAGQIGILNEVLDGFDNLGDIKDPQERNKARLRLMDRARKVSLDVRAADPRNTSMEAGGKLDVLADNVHRIYQQWDADRGTQLVFLDRSVPKAKGDDAVLKEYDALVAAQNEALRAGDEAGQRRAGEALERFDPNEMEELRAAQTGGWNAYQQIKDNLIARGIPADEIRFVQEANSDAQKKALFDAVNDGTVRVLIGSTPRMGAGTNVQKRLVALHHADVTWKPSDIEQREGRIIRQGNSLLDKYGMDKFAVEILAYATERTIDAKMWSLNSSKLRTINGIRKYDGAFSMDFEDEESVSMAELAALASGDPLLLERVKLMSEIDKLELLKRQHARKEWGIISQIEDAERTIARAPARIAALQQDMGVLSAGQAAMEAAAAQRRVTVEGQQYSDPTAARAAVHAAVQTQQQGDEKAKVSINVGGRRLTTMDGANSAITTALGDSTPFAMTVGEQTLGARTDAARALANIAQQQSNKLEAGEEVTVPAGRYLGLPLEMTVVHNNHGGHYVTLAVLRADGSTLQTADTNIRADTAYTTSFLRGAVEKLEEALEPGRLSYQISYQEKALASAQAGLPDLQARKGGAWPQQGELNAKNERLSQVISLLSSGVQSSAPGVRFSMNPLMNADGSYRRQAPVAGGALFSRKRIDTDDQLVNVYAQIAQDDDAFRIPDSGARTLAGVMADMAPGVAVDDFYSAGHREEGDPMADRVWHISAQDGTGANAFVYRNTRARQIWLDISNWKEGRSGNRIYQAVATWAHNTGTQFIGDPAGLSDKALYRRTEQMLSSALRHGTTQHLAPHARQQEATHTKNGEAMRPVHWRDGHDAKNLRELLLSSYTNIRTVFPEIDDVHYNFSTGQFERAPASVRASGGPLLADQSAAGEPVAQHGLGAGADRGAAGRSVDGADEGQGQLARVAAIPVTDADFRALGESVRRAYDVLFPSGRGAFTPPIGVSDLKRAALTGTVLRAEGSEVGRAVLDHVSERLLQRVSPQLAGLLYSPSADYFRESDEFSPAVIDAVPHHGVLPLAATLSGADLLQAMKDTEQLNRQLIKEGIAPVRALRTAPSSDFALARQIGAALGIPVHFVGQNSAFEGVAHKGVAFLSEGMRNPELAIAGHETLHALEQSNPALGERLRQQIRAYLKAGVVQERQLQEYAASGFQDVSLEKAEGEVLADINGAMWLDPQFWSDLAKADASLFRTVAYKFMELAAKAISALRSRRFDVARLVTDVAAVRAIMVDTWAQHAQGLHARDDISAPAAFSPAGGDHAAALDKARDADRQLAEVALQYGGRDAYLAQKAAGATLLTYPQWLITKTPNFKQFYGDWEAKHGPAADAAIHLGHQNGEEYGGPYSVADDAAGGTPSFFGQSGPVRTIGGTGESAAREPAVYYHGTTADIDAFDLNHPGRKDHGWLGTGVYVTSSEFVAHGYADIKGTEGKNIVPVFVAVKNPYVAPAGLKSKLKNAPREVVDAFTARLAADGHDGVVFETRAGAQELVAFNPAAVKSAIGNNGAFDKGNADLRFSKTDGAAKAVKIAWSDDHEPGQNPAGISAYVEGHEGKAFMFAEDNADGTYSIQESGLPPELRGQGYGVKMYQALIDEMARRGQVLTSDVSVSPAAQHVYQALQDRGYGIERNPNVSADPDTGALESNDGKPVYRIIPRDGGLLFSRAGIGEAIASAANNAAALRLPAGYLVGDLFNQSGKISWWHKTIGTMENLAKRQPAFARVYDAVQSFIGDISRYAVAAADLAPTLLPKLEDFKDVFGKDRKKPLTAEDTKAIGAPIFEGTLSWARDANGKPVKMEVLEAQAAQLTTEQKAQILLQKGIIDDGQNQAWLGQSGMMYQNIIDSKFTKTQLAAGVVWTDPELRELFSLNDHQIALYREFRAALDKSLTNLSISEMVKFAGKDAKGMLEQAIAAPDIKAAGELLRDHFIALAQQEPDKADMHLTTASQLMDLADKGEDLIRRGYAPLSRFGKYTVYVQQGEEQVYFGMFETQYEASKMARDMAAEHPDATVTHGTVSEDAYKLFAGVSPETIELFGSMVGLDSQANAASTEVYQTYLKLAKNNRSSMKRLIQRKGIAGFSEDAARVLAGFIYSNARLTAGNAHLGEVDEAITEIPKQQGELTDAAMQLRESIRNPEGGNKLGGLMFAQFLGGSVASAMVNLTQPVTMTLPYLSQFGGIAKAGSRLAAAIRDAGKETTGEAHLDEALRWAADEGIVAPQEVHYLQAQAAGKGALRSGDGTRAGNARAALNNALSKVQLGWGKLFAMAELTNRRVTFIAAYRTAIDENIPNPAKFAEEAVSQTQGTYNSGNKPRWARGAIGGVLMTFKQYSIGYLELLSRMAFAGAPGSKERAAGRRAALYMLAVLFLMSGADGLPFEADLEDAIDGLMQRLGYNYSTKRAKQAFLTDVLGQGGADFALKGLSSMPGMPVDVAGRFGMGNLIPGTGLLTKKQSYTQDLGELAGPAGDIAKRAFSATGKALGGDIAGAAMDLSPASVRNAVKGADMIATGQYSDGRGYKVNDVTPMEGVLKIVGFQPNSTANIQDAKGQALDAIAQNRMRSSEIQEHWAQGIAAQDPAMIAQAREWRDDWNSKNPDTPIRVNMPAIAKRVRSMRQDALNRTQKTAPAALKATVRNELSEVRH
jgi:N12 class adenine-specific DNA methylase/ribosomal protein S18 acetylase RimI-like enzyme